MLGKHKYSMETFCLQQLPQLTEVKKKVTSHKKLFFLMILVHYNPSLPFKQEHNFSVDGTSAQWPDSGLFLRYIPSLD